MVFSCPLARFFGLLEVLQHRLAGAGPEDVNWYAGKEGAQAACLQRAKMGVPLWLISIYHSRVQAAGVLFSCSG